MKWLFAILVALNIVVFGITLDHSLNGKERAASAGTEPPVSDGVHELPAAVAGASAKGAGDVSGWIKAGDNASAAESKVDETFIPKAPATEQQLAAEKERLEREKKLLADKQKKEREAKLAKSGEAAQQAAGGADLGTLPEGAAQKSSTAGSSGAACARAASVTMLEDDYHRIKGMLSQWPHAANRIVEKRDGGGAKKATKYMVISPIQADAQAQMSEMSAKGFNTALSGGGVLVGVYNDRAAAAAMLGKLQSAGFGGQIREQGGGADESMSVSKMQVFFSGVDESGLQSIQSIVGRYGRLQRGGCK